MDDPRSASPDHADTKTRALLVSVFTIGTCGLIYELLAGTIASYLLGDSVTQFSTIIGAYLFSRGVGSYLSRYFRRDLITRFIEIEILVSVIGGISSPVLFFAFAEVAAFRVVLIGWVAATGLVVGLEIPFLIRILEDQFPLHDLVSKVLSLDYLGALAASLLFPLWLVPRVGLMRSSFLFGVLNVLVAVWTSHLFRRQHRRPWLTAQAYGALVLLLAGVAFSDDLMEWSEQRISMTPKPRVNQVERYPIEDGDADRQPSNRRPVYLASEHVEPSAEQLHAAGDEYIRPDRYRRRDARDQQEKPDEGRGRGHGGPTRRAGSRGQ